MITEVELIQSCINCNELAQRRFYSQYASLLKGVCMRYERDKDTVQDLLQEIFIKIFKNLPNFSGAGSFEGWLKRIAVNTCIDHINKTKKRKESPISENEDFETEESEINEANIVSQLIEVGFTKESLIELLYSLPQNYSTVFNLFHIDNLSHQQIANLLNISESLSRKWLFRAKELLKKELMASLQTPKQYTK